MTKITDEARKEALEWLETSVVDCRGNWDSKNCKDSCPSGHCKDMVELLRSALEPQTVTREWAMDVTDDMATSEHPDERLINRLKEQGIEVTGLSPDDKSNQGGQQ